MDPFNQAVDRSSEFARTLFQLATTMANTLEFVVHDQSFRIGVKPRGNEEDRQRSSKNRSQETPYASENSTSQEIAVRSLYCEPGTTGVFFLKNGVLWNLGR